MKRILLIFFLFCLGSVVSCDDITRPAPDPSAKSERLAREAKNPPEIKKTQLTPENLIETYNLIVEIRNGLKEWEVKLDQLQKSQDLYFSANRNTFERWVSENAVIITIREERISPEKNQLPNEHPAVSLSLALKELKNMMGDYTNHYFLQRPLHPEYEKELRRWMEDFQERMRTWKFSETTAPPPSAPAPTPILAPGSTP